MHKRSKGTVLEPSPLKFRRTCNKLGLANHRSEKAISFGHLQPPRLVNNYMRQGAVFTISSPDAIINRTAVLTGEPKWGYVAYPLGLKGIIVGEGDTIKTVDDRGIEILKVMEVE